MEYVELYSRTNSCRLALPALPSLYSDHSLDYVDGRVLLCARKSCLSLSPDLSWSPHSNLTSWREGQASAVHRYRPPPPLLPQEHRASVWWWKRNGHDYHGNLAP